MTGPSHTYLGTPRISAICVSACHLGAGFQRGAGSSSVPGYARSKEMLARLRFSLSLLIDVFHVHFLTSRSFSPFWWGQRHGLSARRLALKGDSDLPLPLPGVAVAGSGKREKGSLSWSAKGTVTVGAVQRSGSRGRHVSTGRGQDLERCQVGGQWG